MKRATFIILCLEGAVLSFNVAAAAALVPSIAKDFGVSQFLAGQIVCLYMLPYGLAALIYGPLVRAFDARKIELLCMFCFSAANVFAGLSPNIHSLFAARFFMGFFGASVIPLALILIARQVPAEERGKYVGTFFSATFVASLAGLFLSGIIPWREIFLIPAFLGFTILIAMYFSLPRFKRDLAEPKVTPALLKKYIKDYLAAFKDKAVFSIFTYIFFISLIYHGLQQWLGVYFSFNFKFEQFLISMLITLTSFSGIFGEVIGGRLADKLGRLATVNLGLALMAISALLLIIKAPFAVLAALMVIWGLGWTFNHAAVSTMLTDLPKEFLNEAASLNSSVRFLAGGLGAALGGVILRQNFTFGLIIFGLSMILLLSFSRKLLFTAITKSR